MKKMLLLAAVVTLTSAWTGCNRGWPGCFCRNNEVGECAVSDACECQPACESNATRYGVRSGTVEYVQPPAPTSSPDPGPAPARQ